MAPGDPIVVDDEDMGTATESQVINEEYKIWKKNTPFLYDTVITHALTWPSLTCQWLPDEQTPREGQDGEDYSIHRLILGTHTSNQANDHLMIAEVLLPKSNGDAPGKEVAEMYDEDRQELGSYTKSPARIRVVQTINHDGEVNRARYMPQNPDLIATKTVRGDVYVFDRSKHETNAPKNGGCKPNIILKGQTMEGYGLSWNKVKEGNILSASEDTTVAHWDIQSYNKADSSLQPVRKYSGHSANVGDVDWHPENEWMFGSVGDDKQLMIWDTRNGESDRKPSMQHEGHAAEINTVAFAPSSSYLLLTGSSDHTVALWDIRKLSLKLHSFESHTDDVLQVAWSPHSPVHFASAGADRRVHIWNLAAIGEEQTPDDAEDGPPELLFVHGGHTARVSDLSWSPMAKWHVATAADDNILQVWEPSRHIRAAADTDVGAMELE